jgi:hypothetical protein
MPIPYLFQPTLVLNTLGERDGRRERERGFGGKNWGPHAGFNILGFPLKEKNRRTIAI